MSRQNKVNPGIYTQRGRLTQDDAARELRKQTAAGSRDTEGPRTRRDRLATAKAAASRSTTGTGGAKAGKATATAAKKTAKPTRKAALARNAGGPGGAPRR